MRRIHVSAVIAGVVAILALVVVGPLGVSSQQGREDASRAMSHFYGRGIAYDPEYGDREPVRYAGVRASILLRTPDCDFREVTDRAVFYSGDRFRIRIMPNFDAYLYLFLREADGSGRLLFPSRQFGDGRNRVDEYTTVSIPDAGWFRFDDDPGLETIYLFASGEPIDALEDIFDSESAGESQGARVLRRIEELFAGRRHSRGLMYEDFSEEYDSEEAEGTSAMYFVQRYRGDVPFVARRIVLTHRPR